MKGDEAAAAAAAKKELYWATKGRKPRERRTITVMECPACRAAGLDARRGPFVKVRIAGGHGYSHQGCAAPKARP